MGNYSPVKGKPLGPYSGPARKRPKSETPLLVWLREKGMTVWAFAQLIGANPKTVYYWMYGQVIPELVYAYKIEMATEGGVSMVSWLGTELAKMQWEHNHSDIENELEMRRRSNKKYYQKKQRERYTPDGTDPQED